MKIHWSFWVICIAGLLWNAGGAANYLMQTNAEFVAGLPESHRAIIHNRPIWATGGFAIGVFGGAIGCLLLLFRNSLAVHVLAVSLVGIAVTIIHTILVVVSPVVFSAAEVVIMVVLPALVALFLMWYSLHAVTRYQFRNT